MTRNELIDQVLDATTLPEIFAARHALQDWVQAYPNDLGIVDGFEQLYIMEDALQTSTDTGETSRELAAVV